MIKFEDIVLPSQVDRALQHEGMDCVIGAKLALLALANQPLGPTREFMEEICEEDVDEIVTRWQRVAFVKQTPPLTLEEQRAALLEQARSGAITLEEGLEASFKLGQKYEEDYDDDDD